MSQEEAAKVVPYTLRAIYIHKSQLRLADEFDPIMPGQPLQGKFRTEGGQVICKETKELVSGDDVSATTRSCTFITHFEFRYVQPADVAQPDVDTEAYLVAEISADIAIDYLIGVPEMPSQDDMQQWGASNVLLHAWPYWREYCHNAMTRMNLPVSIIPLLQVTAPKQVPGSQPTDKDS